MRFRELPNKIEILPRDATKKNTYLLHLPLSSPDDIPECTIIWLTDGEFAKDYEYAYEESLRDLWPALATNIKKKET